VTSPPGVNAGILSLLKTETIRRSRPGSATVVDDGTLDLKKYGSRDRKHQFITTASSGYVRSMRVVSATAHGTVSAMTDGDRDVTESSETKRDAGDVADSPGQSRIRDLLGGDSSDEVVDDSETADQRPSDAQATPTDITASPSISARLRGRLSAGTRSTVAAYATVLIAVCLLVAAGGGYLTYTAMTAPATQTETITDAEWTADAEFAHGVTIQEPTTVFDHGEELRDRPVYFGRLAPELEGRYILTHGGDVESANGTVELQLVIEATEQQGDEEVVHWRETDHLASTEITDLEAGDETAVSFDIDVADLTLQVEDISDELGASPGSTEIQVVADTMLETEAAGESMTEEWTDELDIDLSVNVEGPGESNSTGASGSANVTGGTYSVDQDVSEPRTQTVTTTTTVPVEQSPEELYAGPLLIAVGLLAAGGIGLARRHGVFAVSTAERQRLSFARARSDYTEWISRGHPPESEPQQRIYLESLADLVNVAIDSNRRVIEQLDPVRYAVWVDDIEYVFDPPAALEGRILPATDGVTVAVNDPVGGDENDDTRKPADDPTVDDDDTRTPVRDASDDHDPFVPADVSDESPPPIETDTDDTDTERE